MFLWRRGDAHGIVRMPVVAAMSLYRGARTSPRDLLRPRSGTRSGNAAAHNRQCEAIFSQGSGAPTGLARVPANFAARARVMSRGGLSVAPWGVGGWFGFARARNLAKSTIVLIIVPSHVVN